MQKHTLKARIRAHIRAQSLITNDARFEYLVDFFLRTDATVQSFKEESFRMRHTMKTIIVFFFKLNASSRVRPSLSLSSTGCGLLQKTAIYFFWGGGIEAVSASNGHCRAMGWWVERGEQWSGLSRR